MRVLGALWMCVLVSTVQGQLTVRPARSQADVQLLFITSEFGSIGQDIETKLIGNPEAFGIFDNGNFGVGAKPNRAPDNDMRRGIIVSTGKAADATNLDMKEGTDFAPTGTAGDDISLEFKFTVRQKSTIGFKYVFASREIPQYGGDKNDKFAMYSYSEGASLAQRKNIAQLPGALEQDVTVNNLTPSCLKDSKWRDEIILNFNEVASRNAGDCTAAGRKNPNAFGVGRRNFGYTGYTEVLQAVATFEANARNVLNISVIDQEDGWFDTAVLLAANTLSVVSEFTYSADDWGPCSTACDAGTQTRTVYCRTLSGNQRVDPANCKDARPESTRTCKLRDCNAWSYKWSDWSGCSATCGSATQTRQLQCISSRGVLTDVNDPLCPREKPTGITSKQCTLEACVIAEWKYTEWTSCSHTCDSGVQYRELKCMSGGAEVETTFCRGAMPREGVQQTCNPQPCGALTWRLSEWSGCTVSCGGGTRNRILDCVDETGSTVDNSRCQQREKPTDSLSEACMTGECYKYELKLGEWGFCSASCGEGSQRREQMCMQTLADGEIAGLGTVTDMRNCAGMALSNTADETTQPCDAGACPSYKYRLTEWSSCSSTCDNGYRTREEQCVSSDAAANSTETVSKGRCVAVGLTQLSCRPGQTPGATATETGWLNPREGTAVAGCSEIEEKCDLPPCVSYEYSTTEWGECSLKCGGGIARRERACRREDDKEEVDIKFCTTLPNPCGAATPPPTRPYVAPYVPPPFNPLPPPIIFTNPPIFIRTVPVPFPQPAPIIFTQSPILFVPTPPTFGFTPPPVVWTPVGNTVGGGNCTDANTVCPIWKQLGQCDGASAETTRTMCPMSCGTCGTAVNTGAAGRRRLLAAHTLGDQCRNGLDQQQGATSELRCIAMRGCCYNAANDDCNACWTGVGPAPGAAIGVPCGTTTCPVGMNCYAPNTPQQTCINQGTVGSVLPRPEPRAAGIPCGTTTCPVGMDCYAPNTPQQTCIQQGSLGSSFNPQPAPTPASGSTWINPREASPSGPAECGLEKSCNTNPCVEYQWKCTDFKACDVTCGVGTKARKCECASTEGVVEDENCDSNLLGAKPSQTITCNTFTSCEGKYSYSVSPWCTQQDDPCKGDKVTFARQVQCVDGTGTAVANKMCPMEAPAGDVTCMNQDMYNDLATQLSREKGCDKEEGAVWTPPAKDPLDEAWDVIRRKIGLGFWNGIL